MGVLFLVVGLFLVFVIGVIVMRLFSSIFVFVVVVSFDELEFEEVVKFDVGLDMVDVVLVESFEFEFEFEVEFEFMVFEVGELEV